MISVFKKLAPRYSRIVRRYALDVWREKKPVMRDKIFFEDAERFKLAYERELRKYYQQEQIKIYPGTITAKGDAWLVQQKALAESVKVIARAKKDKLIAVEFDKLKTEQDGDVQRAIDRIYLSTEDIKKGGEVYRVFSFEDNFEAKAMQIGEEAAFDLGREINETVISQDSDEFGWETQRDNRVRTTHKKLAGKNFIISDPPTTRDKYGREHTGLPGTDWGCRCWMAPSWPGKKVLRNYTVSE